MTDAECVRFLQWALPKLHMRWRGFRRVRRQVCKRLARRLTELRLDSPAAYRKELHDNPEEWRHLEQLCRVTISRFYRDKRVFDVLGDAVLPLLAQHALARPVRTLRCWSAGCASGEEPYTLSLLWKMRVAPQYPGLAFTVLATDIDATLLKRARQGCYLCSSLRELPQAWLRDAFVQHDNRYCLRSIYREGVTFAQQDLRRSSPSGPFDLVLCRNLAFTYFDLEMQRHIAAVMDRLLAAQGVLVLGSHEKLPPPPTAFRPWQSPLPIYQKAEADRLPGDRTSGHSRPLL